MNQAGKAVYLLMLRKVWSSLLNLVVMAYLARKLDHASFGIVAVSGVLINMASLVCATGIADYIIYYSGEEQSKVRNSAFWMVVLLSLLMAVLLGFLSTWWADFNNDIRIRQVLYLLLIGFVAEMIGAVPRSILRKDLDYSGLVFLLTLSGTATILLQLLLAYLNFGVYSLVLPVAIINPMLTLFLILKSKIELSLSNFFFQWRRIYHYSKHIIASNVLSIFVNSGDTLIVSKVLGVERLGVYNLSFNLSNVFHTNVLPVITDVSLPVLAKVAGNQEQLRSYYLKIIGLITLLSAPILSVFIFHAPLIIRVLYGPSWAEAALPLSLLSVFTLMRSISSPTSSLFNATGNPRLGFIFNLWFSPVFLISVGLGSYFGMMGVVIAVVLARVVGAQVLLHSALKLIQVKLKDMYQHIYPVLWSSFFVFMSGFLVLRWFPVNMYSEFGIIIAEEVLILIMLKFFYSDYLKRLVRDITGIDHRLGFLNKLVDAKAG